MEKVGFDTLITKGAIKAIFVSPDAEKDKPHILQVLGINSNADRTNKMISFK